MDKSKQRAANFLEKEIRTYAALSLFLAKKGCKQHVRIGSSTILLGPLFYKERIKEAKKIVSELKRPD